jgi:tryptophan synthase alpha chain
MTASPSPIAQAFARLRSAGHMAFMPFITAADPDLQTTQALLRTLAESGVDFIEIGFPYSDPIADGPVIQASYTRALKRHVSVAQIMSAIGEVTAAAPAGKARMPPLVAMVAYAIIFRMGTSAFVRQAREAGFAGLIVPDLPADEAHDMARLAKSAGLDLIQLIAPTTSRERALKIMAAASGFLYCVSVAGTTGVRDQLPHELREQLAWLKTQSQLPLAVGFGVSRPEQVDELRGLADGVIVGSALVRQVAALAESAAPAEKVLFNVRQLATAMCAAAHCQG